MSVDNCPKCGMNFIGDPIPEDIVEHYAGTHWRKEIGIDGQDLGIYDGIVAYMCPKCEHYFPRGSEPWAMEMFAKFKKEMGIKDE